MCVKMVQGRHSFRWNSQRVCSTLFAMPEVSIGFFPDVGAASFLQRLPPGVALLLALTGMSLKGGQVYQLGLATHCVPSAALPQLKSAVSTPRFSDLPAVDAALRRFQVWLAPYPPWYTDDHATCYRVSAELSPF